MLLTQNFSYYLFFAIICAITLPAVITLITTALGVIFPFVWSRFKGYRTKIIAVLTSIIGGMMIISDTVLPYLASVTGMETGTITGIIVAVLGLINYIMRLITETPAADMVNISKRVSGTLDDVNDEVDVLKSKMK